MAVPSLLEISLTPPLIYIYLIIKIFLEIDKTILVAVECSENMITELICIPGRETFRVDLHTHTNLSILTFKKYLFF